MADVTLPQLGETVTEGTITRWFKKVGDTVAADEPLFEVSTDKVDTEVPSPVAGRAREIRANEGDTVPVGAVIAVVGGERGRGACTGAGARGRAAAGSGGREAPRARAARARAPAPAPVRGRALLRRRRHRGRAAPTPTGVGRGARPATTGCSRRSCAGSSPSTASTRTTITGTGPGGRITRDDVLDHIDKLGQRAAAPAPPRRRPPPRPPLPPLLRAGRRACGRRGSGARRTAPAAAPAVATGERDTSVPLSKIRKLTGSHMVMSKSVSPHAFSVVEVDYANVDATRSKVKGEWKAAEGFSLTYLPFITRAVVDALGEFPHLNASVGEDELVVHNFIDIGIAVDLDFQGLLVPVVRSAETKRLRAIAREINDLANRARTRKLSPDEITGGTFTISNNGSAGSVLTMPIINQPQVAILSTDAIVRKPVVAKLPDGGEAIVIHPVGNLAMSWDHRAFDGAYAANFLARVKETLETRDWAAEL